MLSGPPRIHISPWGQGKQRTDLGNQGCPDPCNWGHPVSMVGMAQSNVSGTRAVTLPGQEKDWAHQVWKTHRSGCVTAEGLGQLVRGLRKRPGVLSTTHHPHPSPPAPPWVLYSQPSSSPGSHPPLNGPGCKSQKHFLGEGRSAAPLGWY